MTGRVYRIGDYARRGSAPKALSLAWLIRRRANVPETFVWSSPDGATPGHDDLKQLDARSTWAVRSASVAEDGIANSHAGQFLTVLSVSGTEELVAATKRVLASALESRAAEYDARIGGGPTRMDVIYQKMVEPDFAGVAFSRNPLTNLNEIVIETVDGLGEALVGEGRTPERWVWRGSGFTEKPPGREDRLVYMRALALEVARLARSYGRPADIEWAWDGALWFLQIRPITGIADVRIYSSRISREVMPGLIKPLVWSINMPLVNAAWIRLIERAVGPSGLRPPDLARQFAFRSYFNMTALGQVFELIGFPHDSLEALMGLPNTPRPRFELSGKALSVLPRALSFAVPLLGYGRQFQREHDDVRAKFRELARADLDRLSDDGVVRHIDALLGAVGRAAEINIVVPLLANVYAALLRRRVAALGFDATLLESAADPMALAQYDPAGAMRRLSSLPDGPLFEEEFASFLSRFGHFSESGNDISVPAWRETPDRVREMIRLAGDSRERPVERLKYEDVRGRAHGPGRWLLDAIYRRAGAFRLYRETISFTYTYGYGLLRPAALELGKRLAARGTLAAADDVMFISLDELRTALSEPRDYAALVRERRAAYEEAKGFVMPESIYGDEFVPVPLAGATKRLRGVGSSRGQYRGPMRVIRSYDEFSRVETGDIVVIPYSDVGWTPLFARAGAVVAESGGMLSHSSIVAREYGIPCVVSATGAMQLPDGATAVVDGLTGDVVVIGEQA